MMAVSTSSRWRAALLLAALTLAVQAANGQSASKLRPQGYVSDFAHVLNPVTVQHLSALCAEVDQKAHAQIALVTVSSLGGEPIDRFSIDLASKWGIGTKGTDRGVMILLAPTDRRYRIEVGYGLEPVLTDALTGRLGREAVPALRARNYDAAALQLTVGVAGAIAASSGVKLTTAPRPPPSQRASDGSPYTPLIILLIIFGFGALSSFGRRGRSGFRRGGWWMGGPWMGGGFGGGFGGGGGGGGFGGFGGGSFGGGGASGSW